MNKEELQALMTEKLDAFKASLPTYTDEKSLNASLDALKAELETKFEGLLTNEKFEELEASTKLVADELTALKLVTNEKAIKEVGFATKDFNAIDEAFKGGASKATATIKAAAAFSTANITSGTHLLSYEFDSMIHEAPREENVVLPSLLKGKTSSRTIYWANRINRDGGSAFIAEGAVKPLMDWEYAEESSLAKKVAVRASMSREILADMDGFKQDVNRILKEDLLEEIETQVINSTISSTAIAGIIPVASGYTTTAMDDSVDAPNTADAIRAAMLQMRLINYKPDSVFLNPTDVALLDLIKDDNGNYIKLQIDGVLKNVKVIETANITAGNFLLMDTRKWTVKMLEDVTIEFGLNGDDFSKNMISVICEARLHSYYNSIDTGAFIYESIATVKTAIDSAV